MVALVSVFEKKWDYKGLYEVVEQEGARKIKVIGVEHLRHLIGLQEGTAKVGEPKKWWTYV